MSFSFKDLMEMEVAPALGCTEPVAIALGAAAAADLLPEKGLDRLDVWVDPNIYKNGLAVTIPGTGGLSGLDMAAALGVLGGDPDRRMEVLGSVDDNTVDAANQALKADQVEVHLLEQHRGIRVEVKLQAGGHTAESIIDGLHDNIISLKLDGEDVTEHRLLSKGAVGGKPGLAELEEWLRGATVEDFLDLLDEMDEDDYAYVAKSVDYNLKLAEHGLKHGPGLGVGRAIERLCRQKLIKKDMIIAARILASAAADARMAGTKLPAMASAGSGNHGLTATLPLRAAYDYLECTERDMLAAVGLSHIVTAHVKAHTGRLSAVCGCSIAAGAGAAAGMAHLMGGNVAHICGAVQNISVDLAGVICDGAKGSCALKLSTAAGNAVQAALLSLQGVVVKSIDGIAGDTMEQTTANIGQLSTQGMIETDRTILQIMLSKHYDRD